MPSDPIEAFLDSDPIEPVSQDASQTTAPGGSQFGTLRLHISLALSFEDLKLTRGQGTRSSGDRPSRRIPGDCAVEVYGCSVPCYMNGPT